MARNFNRTSIQHGRRRQGHNVQKAQWNCVHSRNRVFYNAMTIIIPDEALAGVEVQEAEVRRELAVALFQQDRVTLAQAARLAGMSRVQFQHVLAARGLQVHFTLDDWQDDLKTLNAAPHP
jgi:predicted HTH domain antitoxin